MTTEGLRWRKSSYTGNDDQTDCVELACLSGTDAMAVRDSKAPSGGTLRFGAGWASFARAVRADVLTQ